MAWELRTPQPVLNIRLFSSNRVLTMGNIAALINYSATFAVGFLLSFYLQYVKGLSPAGGVAHTVGTSAARIPVDYRAES